VAHYFRVVPHYFSGCGALCWGLWRTILWPVPHYFGACGALVAHYVGACGALFCGLWRTILGLVAHVFFAACGALFSSLWRTIFRLFRTIFLGCGVLCWACGALLCGQWGTILGLVAHIVRQKPKLMCNDIKISAPQTPNSCATTSKLVRRKPQIRATQQQN
jgi:hypothetical protein